MESEVEWDELGQFFVEGRVFVPKIFEVSGEQEVPEGFNTIAILLDGRKDADLSWDKERMLAHHYGNLGYKILWKMELGLFSSLESPLSHPVQFKTLRFSLEHFVSALYKEFQKESLGISLYEGSIDFTLGFPWELDPKKQGDSQQQRLFCRDACLDFIELLLPALPVELQAFALFDSPKDLSSAELLQLFSPERFEHIRCVVRNKPKGLCALAWEKGESGVGFWGKDLENFQKKELPTAALCMPPSEQISAEQVEMFDHLLQKLERQKRDYRVISEDFLTTQWAGVDELFCVSEAVSDLGFRKLQGFCAAGGSVFSYGRPLSLPDESNLPFYTEVT